MALDLLKWYEKDGITEEAYIQRLEKHKENFHQVYDGFKIPDQDIPTLQSKQTAKIIILAEVWCGHCMVDLPIMFNIARAANIPVKVIPKDDHLDFADHYKTDGKHYIPIFIFMDENGEEIGKWGPMAPEVRALVDKLKVNVPAKDDPGYKKAFRAFADEATEHFLIPDTWNDIYHDILKHLP